MPDLTADAQEALKLAQRFDAALQAKHPLDFVCEADIRDADAILRRLSASQGWISVEERLPEKYIEVLVAFEGQLLAATGQYTGSVHDHNGWCYPAENCGTNDDGSDPVVAYWRDLPDVPSGAQGEQQS